MGDLKDYRARYEELRHLGDGGMGSVFLVRERATGQEFAAKTIRPRYLGARTAERRFEREQRLLAKLASLDHPHIVRMRESFVDDTGAVFVMDYMPGGDLAAKIVSPATSASELAARFDEVADAMATVHAEGIFHRDLKPANVLIDGAGRARVSDFGLAVLAVRDSTQLTRDGAMLGTVYYAAPEQKRDAANVNERADVFSLGLIAYEIAVRESPYALPVRALGHAALDAALKLSWKSDPAQRTVTPKALAVALRAYLLGSSQGVT